MIKIAFLVFFAAAVIIAAAFFVLRQAHRVPDLPAGGAASLFKKGQLWALASSGSHSALALVDTGTSMSLFPKQWSSEGTEHGSETIATPFGQSSLSAHNLGALNVAGLELRDVRALFAETRYPLIGSDVLFGRKNVELSRNGLAFDIDYDPEAATACLRLVLNFQGNTVDTPIKSVFFMMPIDGSEQLVFFDTGRKPALEASAQAPRPTDKPFPRADIRANALGEWNLAPYFARTASVALGPERRAFEYRHYYTDHSVAAPFVMGSQILEDYSIVVDTRKGRACFFKVVR